MLWKLEDLRTLMGRWKKFTKCLGYRTHNHLFLLALKLRHLYYFTWLSTNVEEGFVLLFDAVKQLKTVTMTVIRRY